MKFLSQVKEQPETTAVKLHIEYNRYTEGKSRLEDWKHIVKVAGDQGATVIFKLAKLQPVIAPSSRYLRRDWKVYLAQAEANPVVTGYPVSQLAADMAEKIARQGNTIPPEYVAQAMDLHAGTLNALRVAAPELWLQLPGPTGFAMFWFTSECTYGTPSMRQLKKRHPRYVQWLLAHARNVGTRESVVLDALK